MTNPDPPYPDARQPTLEGLEVGGYTLERLLGHGGMGSVWLGHRHDGRFEGQVAVKLMNLALLGSSGLERFRREGSLLARLTHPGIARLLDAGVAPTRQPYLVIEYIDGEPIDRYAVSHALSTADRVPPSARRARPRPLAALMPGAGHLVHMPSHIYVRIGRYQEAIDHNHHAAHADSALTAADRISPTYAALYVSHNYHFLGFAALLSGQAELGIRAAKRTVATMPPAEAIQLPEYQPLVAFEHLMLQKFGRWDQLLALPLPDSSLPVGRAVAEYARSTALAATGRFEEAEALLPVIGRRGEGSYSPIAKGIVEVAAHSLAGELAGRRGQWAAAERAFRSAMAIEDGFTYMEPPWWIEPVRHPLGALLLRAGKAAPAEAIFREDLVRFPANVWSLVGPRESLAAQGKPSAELAAQAAAAVTQAGHDPKVAHY